MIRKKELEKIISRPFYPITLEMMYKGARDTLKKYIGTTFSDTIFRYNGKTAEMFRLKSDLVKIKEGILKFVKTKKFREGIKRCKKLSISYRKAIQEGKPLNKIINYFLDLYAILMFSYYLTNY